MSHEKTKFDAFKSFYNKNYYPNQSMNSLSQNQWNPRRLDYLKQYDSNRKSFELEIEELGINNISDIIPQEFTSKNFSLKNILNQFIKDLIQQTAPNKKQLLSISCSPIIAEQKEEYESIKRVIEKYINYYMFKNFPIITKFSKSTNNFNTKIVNANNKISLLKKKFSKIKSKYFLVYSKIFLKKQKLKNLKEISENLKKINSFRKTYNLIISNNNTNDKLAFSKNEELMRQIEKFKYNNKSLICFWFTQHLKINKNDFIDNYEDILTKLFITKTTINEFNSLYDIFQSLNKNTDLNKKLLDNLIISYKKNILKIIKGILLSYATIDFNDNQNSDSIKKLRQLQQLSFQEEKLFLAINQICITLMTLIDNINTYIYNKEYVSTKLGKAFYENKKIFKDVLVKKIAKVLVIYSELILNFKEKRYIYLILSSFSLIYLYIESSFQIENSGNKTINQKVITDKKKLSGDNNNNNYKTINKNSANNKIPNSTNVIFNNKMNVNNKNSNPRKINIKMNKTNIIPKKVTNKDIVVTGPNDNMSRKIQNNNKINNNSIPTAPNTLTMNDTPIEFNLLKQNIFNFYILLVTYELKSDIRNLAAQLNIDSFKKIEIQNLNNTLNKRYFRLMRYREFLKLPFSKEKNIPIKNDIKNKLINLSSFVESKFSGFNLKNIFNKPLKDIDITFTQSALNLFYDLFSLMDYSYIVPNLSKKIYENIFILFDYYIYAVVNMFNNNLTQTNFIFTTNKFDDIIKLSKEIDYYNNSFELISFMYKFKNDTLLNLFLEEKLLFTVTPNLSPSVKRKINNNNNETNDINQNNIREKILCYESYKSIYKIIKRMIPENNLNKNKYKNLFNNIKYIFYYNNCNQLIDNNSYINYFITANYINNGKINNPNKYIYIINDKIRELYERLKLILPNNSVKAMANFFSVMIFYIFRVLMQNFNKIKIFNAIKMIEEIKTLEINFKNIVLNDEIKSNKEIDKVFAEFYIFLKCFMETKGNVLKNIVNFKIPLFAINKIFEVNKNISNSGQLELKASLMNYSLKEIQKINNILNNDN